MSIDETGLDLANPRPSTYYIPSIPPKGGDHVDTILGQRVIIGWCPHTVTGYLLSKSFMVDLTLLWLMSIDGIY